jgi:uncharacterized protein (UPF0261 family)
MAKAIAIVGTLDTKGEEIRYIKERIESRGYKAVVIDGGILGQAVARCTLLMPCFTSSGYRLCAQLWWQSY